MYRLAVWLIAAVFIFNTAASLTWIDLPAELSSTADGHHGAVAADRSAADHHDAHSHHVGDDVIAVAPDHDHISQHVDKCCRTCSFARVIGDVIVATVTFSYAAVTFNIGQHDLVGHLVAVDPDIPKSLV